jgi:hypothetical protein
LQLSQGELFLPELGTNYFILIPRLAQGELFLPELERIILNIIVHGPHRELNYSPWLAFSPDLYRYINILYY